MTGECPFRDSPGVASPGPPLHTGKWTQMKATPREGAGWQADWDTRPSWSSSQSLAPVPPQGRAITGGPCLSIPSDQRPKPGASRFGLPPDLEPDTEDPEQHWGPLGREASAEQQRWDGPGEGLLAENLPPAHGPSVLEESLVAGLMPGSLVPAKHFIQLMSLFTPWATVGRAAKLSPGSLLRHRTGRLPVLSGFDF